MKKVVLQINLILVAFSFIVIFLSCNKPTSEIIPDNISSDTIPDNRNPDSIPDNVKPDTIPDIISTDTIPDIISTDIIIGNYNNVIARVYESTITITNISPNNKETKSIEIDINNDDINDLKISIDYISGKWIYDYTKIYINCLNEETKLYSKFYNDILYEATENIFYPFNDGSVKFTKKIKYSCTKRDESYKFSKVEQNAKLINLALGDHIIDDNSFFKNSLITLMDESHGSSPSTDSISNDTTYITDPFYYNDCGNYFNFNTEEYIGIKVSDKIGWIKIMLTDKYSVKLIETAIQQ